MVYYIIFQNENEIDRVKAKNIDEATAYFMKDNVGDFTIAEYNKNKTLYHDVTIKRPRN